jgi:hypothetical protein
VRVGCVRCQEDPTAPARLLIFYLSGALSAAQIDRICACCAGPCDTQANAPVGGFARACGGAGSYGPSAKSPQLTRRRIAESDTARAAKQSTPPHPAPTAGHQRRLASNSACGVYRQSRLSAFLDQARMPTERLRQHA